MLDRKNLFGMTKQELLLIKTKQKGIRSNREAFIDIKQYLEPMSIKQKRRLRFERKKKYFNERNVECY